MALLDSPKYKAQDETFTKLLNHVYDNVDNAKVASQIMDLVHEYSRAYGEWIREIFAV